MHPSGGYTFCYRQAELYEQVCTLRCRAIPYRHLKDVSLFLNISWDTTKDIQNRYLQRHYGNLNLSKLEYIGIDEFAVHKGHVYKTIVADLLTGLVVYVGDGKGADALKRFWKKVRKAKTAIKTVASTPYDDNPDVYRAGMFSIYTGLRKNDILALRWEDTHHDRVRIYIRFRIKKTDTLIQLPLSLPAIRVLGEPESDGKTFPMITESILVTHVSRCVSKAKKSASTSPSTASGTLLLCSCWTRVSTFTPLLHSSDIVRYRALRTMPRCLRRK